MKKYWNLLTFLSLTGLILAQGDLSLKIDEIRFGELHARGFKLTRSRTIEIDAIGGGVESRSRQGKYRSRSYDHSNMFIYAWILNADSRELMWRMTINNTSRNNGDLLRGYSGSLDLPAGAYEVYYSAQKPNRISLDDSGIPSLKEIFRNIFGSDWIEDLPGECHLVIDGLDEVFSERDVNNFHRSLRQKAVVSISGKFDSEAIEERFTLQQPGEFEIYALGEALDSEVFDYGWIIREDDHERIWEMLDENSVYAGGSEKNRAWRTTINLAPGNYAVFYVTDDAHSPQEWNANPPYDPAFWGITIRGVGGRYNPGSITEHRKKDFQEILSLTRIGNHRFVQEGFEIRKTTSIRIFGLGEGVDGEMADFGWITNARTGEKVWEMEYHSSRHAGGARKNRLFDETLTLPAGAYWVYYITDGSHAFGTWNSKPPRNTTKWGITIYAVDSNFDMRDVKKFKDSFTEPIVELTEIGDDDFVQKGFQTDREITLRVFAMGEGSDGEMHDYGWIEDARTGQQVWRMDYHDTRHAGGGRKNRFVDEFVTLSPGSYMVYYRSDGSHSFHDWNTSPPHKPHRWGISVFPVDDNTRGVETFNQDDDWEGRPFIELTEIRNNEQVFQRFRIDKTSRIRIIALGEGHDELVDYGWISNVATGERIWEMRYEKTRHAGGGKNRLSDEVITLDPGQYMVYYRTDDSHAYNSWNTQRPDNPEKWGITLSFIDKTADEAGLQVFDDAAQRGNIIAKIIEVENDEHVRRTFELSRQTTIRIYAIGEGDDHEMFDYGWIEDRRSGEVVWIMEYHEAQWAGGAHKNRNVNTTMTLPRGEYVLHYVSDGSHAFNRWNQSPPDDRRNYGITLYELSTD